MTRLLGALGLFGILLTLGACRTDGPRPAGEETVGPLADSLERGYERLARVYDSLGDSLPADVRRMHGAMGQMHHRRDRSRAGKSTGDHHGMGGRHMGREDGGHHPPGTGHGRGRAGRTDRDSVGRRREWHRQMMAMHGEMARRHDRSARSGLAARHRRMQRRHRRMMRARPSTGAGAGTDASPPAEAVPEGAARGGALYARHCASCHGRDGQGIGTFPPLAGAAWATGPTDEAVRIVLHGLRGPVSVQGRSYDSLMPGLGDRLSDAEVAAVLSFVRSSWGNAADSVTVSEVREVRRRSQGRTTPWTASELRDDP